MDFIVQNFGRLLTEQAIYEIVMGYAKASGLAEIAPHDLRWTFAKLARKGGSALDQIQLSLPDTDRFRQQSCYLGVEQDLTDALCDHLGLRLQKDTRGGLNVKAAIVGKLRSARG